MVGDSTCSCLSSLPTTAVGLRLSGLVAQRTFPARTSEGGKWRRVAGWQVAGGAAPLCGAPALGACPGEVANLPVEAALGPPLPLATASADPGCPPALSPAAWTESSISAGLTRGRAGPWGPSSRHWAPALPHFAADSSPKQNRLSSLFFLWQSSPWLPFGGAAEGSAGQEWGPASPPAGTGTVCLGPGPRSALTVAGEQALSWQLPEDDASASVQRCLWVGVKTPVGLSNWSVPVEASSADISSGRWVGDVGPRGGFSHKNDG